MCSTGAQSKASARLTWPAFRWALERDYDYVFEMDSDFSHDPKYLPEFLRMPSRMPTW